MVFVGIPLEGKLFSPLGETLCLIPIPLGVGCTDTRSLPPKPVTYLVYLLFPYLSYAHTARGHKRLQLL